ncbi:Nucleic-acid-binding protein from mobile element jockey [Chionoecetes opilio]|uniref:Nucleic-acid-binding protein from mobile element jockey n=1 Tax=Chionoecetes opilio TaxID=41210 RepID=A0A8J4XYG6_CHIOP|nr:Nucleic-acid-binding protein from mobile element jockey [Chionoecetes opilio]
MLSRQGWGSGLRSAAQNPRSSSSPPTHLTPKEAARSPERELASANEAHDDDDESVQSLVIDMSVRSEDQQEAAQGKDWTTVVNGRAARPKFKLGSLVDHASAYLAITALEDENPTLRMEAQPHVVSATRLRGRDNIATRQVLIVHEGPPPAKLTLRSWGTYTLRPYRSEPVRCYKCQRFNHLQVRCVHFVRCGVCSLNHPTEDCIGRHKSNEATTAKCPNCGRKHHAWNPQCPERLRRMPRLQQQPQAPRWRQHRYHETRGQPQEQQRQHRFIPAPLPARPAWVKAAKQPSPLIPRDPTPGRGSDGRESEAQLPVSVEEAATITPAAILSPPLPKRETGTRSRSPHRSRPQGQPPSQLPAPAVPEAPATARARAEGRRTASCHRYDNVPVSEETRAIADCIIVRMMHVMRRLLRRTELAPATEEEVDAFLLEEME